MIGEHVTKAMTHPSIVDKWSNLVYLVDAGSDISAFPAALTQSFKIMDLRYLALTEEWKKKPILIANIINYTEISNLWYHKFFVFPKETTLQI